MFRLPNPRVLPGCGAAAALLVLTLAAPTARSQGAYPERPLTVVVPFSAGGATDVAARLLAKEMAATLGQAIVVENKAGAAGAIGAASVARAAPDGYTVCFCGGGPLVILKLLDARLPYDPLRDFAPVTLSHQVDYVLAVSTASPIRSVRDLVAAAKASPGKLAYASTGNGGPAHLGQEYFNRLAGVDITHVPYKGESQILPDLVNGQLALGIFSAQLGEQMQQAGKVRLIGTWSAQRLARLPKLPTVAEQGYPSFSAGTFIGIMVPRGTPGPVIDKLNAVYVKALNEPGLRKQLLEMGLTPVGSSPAATAAFLHREEVKWSQVIDSLGMRGRN
jgi:tripartite-type tricarboxylate transporter receptor subunit TctC